MSLTKETISCCPLCIHLPRHAFHIRYFVLKYTRKQDTNLCEQNYCPSSDYYPKDINAYAKTPLTGL